MKSEQDNDRDPCTGFPTTHKAKLSIPTISWNNGDSLCRGFSDNKHSPNGDDGNFLDSQKREATKECEENDHNYRHCLGISFAILSAITFSFNALIAKMLNHFHPFNLGAWTFLAMTLLGVLTLIYEIKVSGNTTIFNSIIPMNSRSNMKTTAILLVRSLTGICASILFFYAVKYLTVADALVIDATSPIFVYIIAFLIFGEKFGVLPIFTTVLAFVGVALITRPPLLSLLANSNDDRAYNELKYDMNNLIGVALASATMLCIVGTIISLKFLDNVHHTLVNCTFGVLGCIQCGLVSWIWGILSVPQDPSDILKIAVGGVLFYLGQAFITVALKYTHAGPVGLMRTTEVMFIFLWQFLFLGVIPDMYSSVGAILVLLGVILTVMRNWINSLSDDSQLQQKCKYLLY